MPLSLIAYQTLRGDVPFRVWLDSIADRQVRYRIEARLARVKSGNLGDYKSIGVGLWEMRLAFGPGYRIYFTRSGADVIILFAGGHKGTQARDIRTAKELYRECQTRVSTLGNTVGRDH